MKPHNRFYAFMYRTFGWMLRILHPTEVEGLGTFANPHVYSLVYNGAYMLPNLIIAMAIAALLFVPLKKYFTGDDLKR